MSIRLVFADCDMVMSQLRSLVLSSAYRGVESVDKPELFARHRFAVGILPIYPADSLVLGNSPRAIERHDCAVFVSRNIYQRVFVRL